MTGVELLLIRHAQPVRIDDSGADTADPPLTDFGWEQSRRIAEFLLTEGVDHVVSSPMQRAMETATPLARALRIEPEVVVDLREIDADATAYLPSEDLKAEGGDRWDAVTDDPIAAHGWDVATFRLRVIPAIDAVIDANPGRTVAVFCHGMVKMVYLQHLMGQDDLFQLRPEYGAIARVMASSRTRTRTVRSANETGHLRDLMVPYV